LINATAVIGPLRKLFPNAQIGFLTSSWARPVIESNVGVSHIHIFDHFLLNRSHPSFFGKVKQHIVTARKALRELRHLRYDIAIDTYHFVQNAIPLLWLARIPIRIGYSSGGFGGLLTHAYFWTDRDRHLVDYHLDLLRPLGLTPPLRQAARPVVTLRLDEEVSALPPDYIVLHPATGAPFREWPVENWSLLARKLEGAGWNLVFTGHGERERENVKLIRSTCPASIDLCGRLSWDQFVSVLKSAKLLVGVESAAGHTAAALGTPCVVIYSGTTNTFQMRPYGAAVRTISDPVACSPCFRTSGCAGMECVRGVRASKVFEACMEALSRYSMSTTKNDA
jgi:ADP-heptose:LPS heptosyltransferase